MVLRCNEHVPPPHDVSREESLLASCGGAVTSRRYCIPVAMQGWRQLHLTKGDFWQFAAQQRLMPPLSAAKIACLPSGGWSLHSPEQLSAEE